MTLCCNISRLSCPLLKTFLFVIFIISQKECCCLPKMHIDVFGRFTGLLIYYTISSSLCEVKTPHWITVYIFLQSGIYRILLMQAEI